VNIIVGRAVDTLEKLDAAQPFDLVFIDADKPSNLEYYNHAKRLTRKGGVIVSEIVHTCSASAGFSSPISAGIIIDSF